jgi:hypothetical protein
VVDSCEHDAEPSGCIQGGNFLNGWVTISFSRELCAMKFANNVPG